MEVAMSLSERDQRVLDSIEDRLVGANPELASLLATFTRLAANEALPAHENIRDGRDARSSRTAHRRECVRWQLVPALLWLVTSLALISVALTLSGRGTGANSPCMVWARTCATQTHAGSP
jgi:Protein of unknown function (DUF3040)